jgi:hypothetical protein
MRAGFSLALHAATGSTSSGRAQSRGYSYAKENT